MKHRAMVLATLAGLWALAMVARLYQLQVVEHQAYSRVASSQQTEGVELHPPRGTVYDRLGRELALSIEVDSAFVVPYEIEDASQAAVELGRVLKRDPRQLIDRLEAPRSFVWLERKLDEPEARAVRELALPGVRFLRESKRYYPQKRVGAQVLGFVGTDDYGLAGLEALYEPRIGGHAARRTLLIDAHRRRLLYPTESVARPESGEDLYLTLDSSIQYIVERELERTVREFRAKQGSVVVLEPATGAVLAMASYPNFDPNEFNLYDAEDRANRVVSDAYEPGSTFKMVTAAAALESNLFDPSDVIDCGNGHIVVDGVRINDHKRFDKLTFAEVLAKSSNVCTVKIARELGAKRLYHQIVKFGFGTKTGIDLPGESSGILRPIERWQKRSYAYISFGQEVSVTPLQLASAFAAVANGGTLYRPFVVAGAAPSGQRPQLWRQPEALGQAVHPSTARSLGRLLEGVVSDGTGKRAAVAGYRVAGKTGTAQKAIPGLGYSPTKFVASFAGFAPARQPVAVAVVAIDEPQGSTHGGSVAAPAFGRIMKQVLAYLGTPPSAELVEAGEEALEAPSSGRFRTASLAQSNLVRPRKLASVAGEAAGGIPDFFGFTARQALDRSAELGLEIELHGSGFVTRQSPSAGSAASQEGVELWLALGAS